MCMYMCVCVCIFVWVCVCMCVYVCVRERERERQIIERAAFHISYGLAKIKVKILPIERYR